jgi:hypothetical protein
MRVVDGRGKILPDCFAETRLVNLPPGVSAVSKNYDGACERVLRSKRIFPIAS